MKNRFSKMIRGTLAALTGLSLFLTPIHSLSAHGASYNYGDALTPGCDGCNDPYKNGSYWTTKDTWLLVGSLLVGAAAGGGIGAAVSSGKDGRRGDPGSDGLPGPRGPEGIPGPVGRFSLTSDRPFGLDAAPAATALTFEFPLSVTASVANGTTATTYVSLPNGIVLESAPTALGLIAMGLPSITVTAPLPFGTYTAGVFIEGAPATVVTFGVGTLIDVIAARDGSTTLLLTPVPAVTLISTQAESSVDFVYGEPDVP